MGACFGASNIPSYLIDGLKRKEELIAVTDLFVETITKQITAGISQPSRFGRPSPFPTMRYTSLSAIRPPIDFPLKLQIMNQLAALAHVPVYKLRFKRDMLSPLDEGDAARDRKEALSSLNNAKPSTDDSENAGDFEDAVVNEGCTDCASGSGFFYYPRLGDLANRFGTNAQKRTEEIFKKYGLKVTVQ